MQPVRDMIHLIGGGGVGMSGLGQLALYLGYQVTASDIAMSPYLEKLAKEGAQVWTGSDPARIPENARVFFSTAVPETDPERMARPDATNRHALLRELTGSFFTIAVAGTHGKTTTSAWLAHTLSRLGSAPVALIGGTVPEWNSNFMSGNGIYQNKPILVTEADESDLSFLHIQISIAAITNVEWDHPDHFPGERDVIRAFQSFASNAIHAGGPVISMAGQIESTDQYGSGSSQVFKGSDDQSLVVNGRQYSLSLPGSHNLQNATVVLRVCRQLGFSDHEILTAMDGFSGVARRLQKLGSAVVSLSDGEGLAAPELADIYDDYAHHPTEIRAGIATLKARYSQVWIFWEPHRISRVCRFHSSFVAELNAADRVWMLPVYSAGDREQDFPEFPEILKELKAHFPDAASGLQHIRANGLSRSQDNEARKPVAIVFMGAGDSSVHAGRFFANLSQDYFTR